MPSTNNKPLVHVVIPALNEQTSLPLLLSELVGKVDEVFVVDNGSTDDTSLVAAANGATVLYEPRRGYGQACLTGIKAASPCSVLVFIDADFCDDPDYLQQLVLPILRGEKDFVLGSRMGPDSIGALTLPQRWGNHLACWLMKLIWRAEYKDLGPFRAISSSALEGLHMCDRNFGWTVEMQISAVRNKLRIKEVLVPYRNRLHGESKVSGTLSGVMKAGSKILYVIAREALRRSTV